MLTAAGHCAGLGLATYSLAVLVVFVVPVFAQTNTESNVVVLERTSASAVHEYAPGLWPHIDSVGIPRNLVVAPSFRSLVQVMLRDSPTFRRQCQRVAIARGLTVRLERLGRSLPHPARARTRIVRNRSGVLAAEIEVPPLDDDVELIAHELEHVVEQLENIDLASNAARAGTGVQALTKEPVTYETARAVTIGRRVSEEVKRAGR